MSHQTRTIVLASIAVIVAASLIAINPSIIGDAQAQMYANDYGYDSNYDSYSEPKKSFLTDIQKIKCVSSNVNVNGVDVTEIPQDNTAVVSADEGATTDAANTQNGNGLGDRINFERNLVNICVNVNDNEQIKVSPPQEEEQTCGFCFFRNVPLEVIDNIPNTVGIDGIGEVCEVLTNTSATTLPQAKINFVKSVLENAGATETEITNVLNCLADIGLLIRPF
jgi:hypothetical protein